MPTVEAYTLSNDDRARSNHPFTSDREITTLFLGCQVNTDLCLPVKKMIWEEDSYRQIDSLDIQQSLTHDDRCLAEFYWWQAKKLGDWVEVVEIGTIAAFKITSQIRSEAADIWLDRIPKTTSTQISNIFERILNDRTPPAIAELAQELLPHNRILCPTRNNGNSTRKHNSESA